MTIKELIDELSKKYQIVVDNGEYFVNPLKNIHLLSSGEIADDQETIYIDYCALNTFQASVPVALITVRPPSNLPKGSVVLIAEEKDLAGIANSVRDMLWEHLKTEAAFLDFSLEAAKSQDMQKMINYAARLLGNAIILIDIGQRVLAHSTIYDIMDPLWAENIKNGYCNEDFVQRVRTSPDMWDWHKSGGEMQIITLDGDIQPKLVMRVVNDSHVIGAAIMIAHHTQIGRLHRQFPLISKVLFDLYMRGQDALFGQVQDSPHGQALFALLDELECDEDYMSGRIKELSFSEEMCVIVARFNEHVENRFIKRTLSMDLKRIFPDGHTVLYKGYVGVLVPCMDHNLKDALQSLAHAKEVSIGISWPFSNIFDFRQHFMQAVDIIKLLDQTHSSDRVCEFTAQSLASLLRHYTGKFPLSRFCHPALMQLREYDERKRTSFYATLQAYIQCDRSLQHTADKLFIHRNTLLYRLHRMEEITRLDFTNTATFLSLHLSFQIESLQS